MGLSEWYSGWKPAKKWERAKPGAYYLHYVNEHGFKTSFFAGIVEKGADRDDVRWYASVWKRPIPQCVEDKVTEFFWTSKEAMRWVGEQLGENGLKVENKKGNCDV